MRGILSTDGHTKVTIIGIQIKQISHFKTHVSTFKLEQEAELFCGFNHSVMSLPIAE